MASPSGRSWMKTKETKSAQSRRVGNTRRRDTPRGRRLARDVEHTAGQGVNAREHICVVDGRNAARTKRTYPSHADLPSNHESLRMKQSFFSLIASLYAAAIINAGCATSSTPCHPVLLPPPPRLVFPSPGATAVSTNVGELLFSAYVTSDIVTLATQLGIPVMAATMVPAPGPLPSSLPTPAGLVYGMISIPTLSPTTTYAVVNTRTFADPCGGTETSALGSFTTR